VAFLLERTKPSIVAQRDLRGKTPLHAACQEYVPAQIVQLLLDANPAAAKVRTTDGQTCLELACHMNAPQKTMELLIDAYPEAVKYLKSTGGSSSVDEEKERKYQLARDYLAYKVRQTEQEADKYQPTVENKTGSTRPDPIPTAKTDARTPLNGAERMKQEALERLENEQYNIERQAAELDRLIQQKESTLATRSFQKQRNHLLNDSGIAQSRSFDNSDIAIPVTTTTPRNVRQQQQQQPRPESRSRSRTPGGGGASRIPHLLDDDDELVMDRNTQRLYPEHQVSSQSYIPFATSRGDPDESGIGCNRTRDMSTVDDVTTDSIDGEDNYNNNKESITAHLEQQLEQALSLLQQNEQQRQMETQQAQDQQHILQNELGVLMDKLALSAEQQRQQQQQQQREEQQQQREQQQQQREQQKQQQQQQRMAHPEDPSEHLPAPIRRTDSNSSTIKTASILPVLSPAIRQPLQPGGVHLRGVGLGEATNLQKSGVNHEAGKDPSIVDNNTITTSSQTMKTSSNNFTENEKECMKDVNGMTPLHLACASGASYTVGQYLMQQFPLAIYQVDNEGNTALHHACACPRTDLELFQLLLGVFPAATLMTNDTDDHAPLHVACKHHSQRLEVIQLLMETTRGVEQELEDAKHAAARKSDDEKKGATDNA